MAEAKQISAGGLEEGRHQARQQDSKTQANSREEG